MCYTDKLLLYLEHFEISCYLRNSSGIFRVNNSYLLYIIVNKSAVQLKKKNKRDVKNCEFSVKLNLLEHLHGAKMQCVSRTLALMTPFLRYLVITQQGGYGFYNTTVVIGCYYKLFLTVYFPPTDESCV